MAARSVRSFVAASALVAAATTVPFASTLAQDAVPSGVGQGADTSAVVEDVESLVRTMQDKLDALGESTAAREAALSELRQQVERATGKLTGAEETNDALRQRAVDLSVTVEDLNAMRAALDEKVAALTNAGEETETALRERVADLEQERRAALQEADRAEAELAERADRLDGLQGELASLRETLAETERARDEAISQYGVRIEASRTELDRAYTVIASLSGRIEGLEARVRAAENETDSRANRIAALEDALAAARTAASDPAGERRAAFAGALAAQLGSRGGAAADSERFSLAADTLFVGATAEITSEGAVALARTADAARAFLAALPAGSPWRLRIEVHAGDGELASGPENTAWDLAGARALAVRRSLTEAGLPARRLLVGGFARADADPESRRVVFRLELS